MYYLITKGDLYLSSPRAQGSTDGHVFSDYSRRWRIYSSNLAQLIAKFADPATAYLAQPRPAIAPRFSDYDHLARIKEWSAGGPGDF